MPKVSVIMAVYNGEKYLAEAIESILNQSLQDVEFIIVNDASTDNTKRIVEKYIAIGKRITLINNDMNMERSVSRNKGIAVAVGEYVSVMDADDIALPEKLNKQAMFLDEHKDVDFVGTSFYTIDGDGRELALVERPASCRKETVHFICYPSIMVRKRCLDDVGGYRSIFEPAEDYDLWLRVADTHGVGNIREALFEYRVHAESSTARQEMPLQVGTWLALQMADERRKSGRDRMNTLSPQDAKRVRDSMLKASRLRRMIMQVCTDAVWCRAAYAIGDYPVAHLYLRKALLMNAFTSAPRLVFKKLVARFLRQVKQTSRE